MNVYLELSPIEFSGGYSLSCAHLLRGVSLIEFNGTYSLIIVHTIADTFLMV